MTDYSNYEEGEIITKKEGEKEVKYEIVKKKSAGNQTRVRLRKVNQ